MRNELSLQEEIAFWEELSKKYSESRNGYIRIDDGTGIHSVCGICSVIGFICKDIDIAHVLRGRLFGYYDSHVDKRSLGNGIFWFSNDVNGAKKRAVLTKKIAEDLKNNE